MFNFKSENLRRSSHKIYLLDEKSELKRTLSFYTILKNVIMELSINSESEVASMKIKIKNK